MATLEEKIAQAVAAALQGTVSAPRKAKASTKAKQAQDKLTYGGPGCATCGKPTREAAKGTQSQNGRNYVRFCPACSEKEGRYAERGSRFATSERTVKAPKAERAGKYTQDELQAMIDALVEDDSLPVVEGDDENGPTDDELAYLTAVEAGIGAGGKNGKAVTLKAHNRTRLGRVMESDGADRSGFYFTLNFKNPAQAEAFTNALPADLQAQVKV